MNNKVILGCQLLFWLSLIIVFGLFLSFMSPLNNSLVFPIVLIGFLSIYFVSGYYGKLIEKEFYLISIEKIAQHQLIPLSMSPALNNIVKWEANKEENEGAHLFVLDFMGKRLNDTAAVLTGELTLLRDARFLDKCDQAGKRGAKIELYYGLSGLKTLSKDEAQEIVEEIMQNKSKIEDLYVQDYLQLYELKERLQYHFSVFDLKNMYIQEEHDHGQFKKVWWIEKAPFFFRLRYRRNITALKRKTISHPSPQELFARLSIFVTGDGSANSIIQ